MVKQRASTYTYTYTTLFSTNARLSILLLLYACSKSPSLPLPFLNISRGFLLLDAHDEAMPEQQQRQARRESFAFGAFFRGRKKMNKPSPPKGTANSVGKAKARGAAAATGANGDAAAGAGQKHVTPENDQGEADVRDPEVAEDLKHWAISKGYAMINAKKTLNSLRKNCASASPAWRDTVLSHLRSVSNPSKV